MCRAPTVRKAAVECLSFMLDASLKKSLFDLHLPGSCVCLHCLCMSVYACLFVHVSTVCATTLIVLI